MDGANQTQHATVLGNQVEVVESFTYLGCLIHCSGSSEPEIKRQANIVREAMFSLDQGPNYINFLRFMVGLSQVPAQVHRKFSIYDIA